jgi:hypothetical protein
VARYRICARGKLFLSRRASRDASRSSRRRRAAPRGHASEKSGGTWAGRSVDTLVDWYSALPGCPGVTWRLPGREPRLHGILDDGALRLRRDRGIRRRPTQTSAGPVLGLAVEAPEKLRSADPVDPRGQRTASSGVGTERSRAAPQRSWAARRRPRPIARTRRPPATRMRPKLRPPKSKAAGA